MTVERLRAVLSRIGPPGSGEPPVTPREIAEILWLAAHVSGEAPGPAAERTEPEQAMAVPSPREPVADPPPAPRPRPAPTPEVSTAGRRALHAPADASEEGEGAASVLVPTAPMLDRPLEVQRALRPLK